mgnify:FL=1
MANLKKTIKKNIKKNIELKKHEDKKKEKVINLLKIVGSILFVIVLAVLVTKLANGDFAKKEETVDTTILAGQTFDKKYDTYYVVFYDFDSDSSVTSRLEKISTNKVFKVNTKDKLNSSVINTSSNTKASSADELKINGVTLIKIENGKNVEYVEGLSNVLSSLSNLK